jgi:hypothetical protein
MREKITKRSVEALRPGDRDTFLWDSEIPGFGCKVAPKGRHVIVLVAHQTGIPTVTCIAATLRSNCVVAVSMWAPEHREETRLVAAPGDLPPHLRFAHSTCHRSQR